MKWLFLLLILLPSVAFAQFPENGVLDSFDGTADPIGGIWTDSLYGNDGCEKSAGVAVRSGTNDPSCYVTESFSGDQEVYATFPDETNVTDDTNYFLWLCLQDEGTANVDGYGIRQNAQTGAQIDRVRVLRLDNGANTQLGANVELVIQNDDKLGMNYIAATGTLELYFDDDGGGWSLERTETDTNHTCTDVHIGMRLDDASHQIDDFGGGDMAEDAGNPFLWLLLSK